MGALDWTGLGASVAGDVVGFGLNQLQRGQQIRDQKDLMKYQNDLNMKNWQVMNDYNTPLAQRQRLAAAGLNADLMYGNGPGNMVSPQPNAVSGGSAPSPVPVSMDIAGDINALAQAKKTGEDTIAQSIRNKYLERQTIEEINNLQATNADLFKGIELKDSTIRQIAQNVSASQAEVDALKKRVGLETFDRLLAQMSKTAEANYLRIQGEDIEKTRDQRIKQMAASAFQAMKSGNLADAQAYITGLFKDPKKAKQWISDCIDSVGSIVGDILGGEKAAEAGKAFVNGFFEGSGHALSHQNPMQP